MPDTTQTNIATEITRIQNDRNTIRTKLVELGMAESTANLDALATATEEELTAIDDVGPITAKYIRQWMDSPQSQDLLARLKAAGLNMTCKEEMVDSRFA